MTRFLLAGAAALGLTTGAAMAQTLTTQTTETTVAPAVPMTTTTSRTVGSAVLPDGDQTITNGNSYRDTDGSLVSTTITNKSYPFLNMITTIRKTDRTMNGVTTETVTTTNTYPPEVGRAPVAPVTTTVQTVRAASR